MQNSAQKSILSIDGERPIDVLFATKSIDTVSSCEVYPSTYIRVITVANGKHTGQKSI